MADWKWCFVAIAISCVSVLGEERANPTTSDAITTSDIITNPITTTTGKPTPIPTTITTHNPTTSTSIPTTTTTHKPTTTTPIPTTPTTHKPTTTTTIPTTSTTHKPTTTTTIPTTTPIPTTTTHKPTPKPTPVPAPSIGVWNVTDSKTNITCILLQFAVQFNVSYAAGKETKSARFNLPIDSLQAGGSCDNSSQWIQLSWPRQQDRSQQSNLTLYYQHNTTSHQYYLSQVNLSLLYAADIFPNATSTKNMELRSSVKAWMTGVNHSYRCKVPQTLKLTSEQEGVSGNLAADITLTDLQEEAFRSEKGRQFSTAADCEIIDVPDVVPIAVGCALGGLVLVVLVAYLVGRRRSQARGYVSM